MNANELRNHPEYKQAMNKITSYSKGFEFSMNWARIPRPQANALKIVMRDAIDAGLIKQISTELSLELEVVAERYQRI